MISKINTLAVVFAILLTTNTTAIAKKSSMILLDETQFQVNSLTDARLTIHKKIFIGDEDSKSFGEIWIHHDDQKEIASIHAEIMDVSGKRIKKLHKRDLREVEASPGFALYSGDKYTGFYLSYASLPYILEYDYTVEFKSLFLWPDWLPQSDIPVVQASYNLKVASDVKYRVKSIGNTTQPDTLENGHVLHWQLGDIPPHPDESMSAPEEEDQYGLQFSPNYFELYGTSGSLQSWSSFGTWVDKLFTGMYTLDPTSINDLKIPEDLPKIEKIAQIYRYVQEKTRYVAISLGIGGWKPHSAQSVGENKYGDCKDLTTYFIGLLNLYEIRAYPVILLTRDSGVVDPSFPIDHFNHVITAIPLDDDTLWVDGTSKTNIIQDLPAMDEGCNALLVQNGVGTMVHTPLSSAADNKVTFTATAEVLLNGSLSIKGSLSAKGNDGQYYRYILLSLTAEKRRKQIIKWLSDYSPTFRLKNLEIANLEQGDADLIISFKGLAQRYANISNKRIFINPSFYRRLQVKAEKPGRRQTTVFYGYPFTQVDIINFTFPSGYQVEAQPDSLYLDESFGSYTYKLSVQDNQLQFIRKRSIKKRLIKLPDYQRFYNYLQEVQSQDRSKVVLIKQ